MNTSTSRAQNTRTVGGMPGPAWRRAAIGMGLEAAALGVLLMLGACSSTKFTSDPATDVTRPGREPAVAERAAPAPSAVTPAPAVAPTDATFPLNTQMQFTPAPASSVVTATGSVQPSVVVSSDDPASGALPPLGPDGKVATVNAFCAFMIEHPVKDQRATPENARVWRGQVIGFCCEDCGPMWDDLSPEDKDKHLAEAMAYKGEARGESGGH